MKHALHANYLDLLAIKEAYSYDSDVHFTLRNSQRLFLLEPASERYMSYQIYLEASLS